MNYEIKLKMQKLRKHVVINSYKDYLPTLADSKIVEEAIPPLKSGEFLVKTDYISVDPYMRSFAESFKLPYDQFGFQSGRVIDSKNSKYVIGSLIVSHSGWRDFVILNGERDDIFHIKPYAPNIDDLPLSFSLGALGMPGMTAYLGLINICKPQLGDIICISSAAGVVGSLVGQIARLKGCTVIGFAGSDEKVYMLINELGFHHAFNYKTVNIDSCLKIVAVNGIDCYFDNVGGDLSANIIQNLKENGRVAICGSISTYGPKKPSIKKTNMSISIEMKSFSFTQWDWTEQRNALAQIKQWLQNGDIIAKETVYNGFNEIPTAFISMLSGNNIGKAVVKI